MTSASDHIGIAVHVQGLEKSYKQLHVLRGVDFDVARGGIFALLGSNGAGSGFSSVKKRLESSGNAKLGQFPHRCLTWCA
jgi:ABC-type sugar transport system ATPase subunit